MKQMTKFTEQFGHEILVGVFDMTEDMSLENEPDRMVAVAGNTARQVFATTFKHKGSLPKDAPTPGHAMKDFQDASAFREAYQCLVGRDLSTGETLSGHARATTETWLRTENPAMLAEARGFVAGQPSPLVDRMVQTAEAMLPAYDRGQEKAARYHEEFMKRQPRAEVTR